MPFQVELEDDEGHVKVPIEYLTSLKLKKGDLVTLDVVPLFGGGQKTFKQLEADMSYAQDFEISLATLHHFIPIWMANFKANLPLFVSDAKSYTDILPAEGDKKRGIVIANGPSLYETDLAPLKSFKGTIVCTNKPLKLLLENGIVPDYVCVLDAGPEVMDSLNHSIVSDFARAMKGIILPTMVDHKVALFAVEHFERNIFWHNPHFSDALAPNICETLTAITKIPSVEHGGNVGTFAYLMAIRPIMCNPIGLLGFDLSYRPKKTWPLEETVKYRFFYIPEKDQYYAMTQVFEYYVSRLIDLFDKSSSKANAVTVNLTPVGPLNAIIGMKSQTLFDYVGEIIRRSD